MTISRRPIFSNLSKRAQRVAGSIVSGRRFFKSFLQLPVSMKLTEIKNLLGVRTQNQADRIMMDMYNEDAYKKNDELARQREIVKRAKRTQTRRERMAPFPMPGSFKNYHAKFTVETKPSNCFISLYNNAVIKRERYENACLIKEGIKEKRKSVLLPSDGDKVWQQFSRLYLNSVKPIIMEKLLSWRCLKVCSTRIFSGVITDDYKQRAVAIKLTGEGLPEPDNMGSVIITSFEEFASYIVNGNPRLNSKGEPIDSKWLVKAGYDFEDFLGIASMDIDILRYSPLTGSSYKPLPALVANSKSIINIQNTDNKCFLWSCIASRHLPENHADRVSQYKQFANEFVYSESDFPMQMDQHGIGKFEKKNNVRVNVYGLDEDDETTKYPLFVSKNTTATEIIQLFFHEGHYSLIKNFQRFIGGDHCYNCPRCLEPYHDKICLDNHVLNCEKLNVNGSLVTAPLPGSVTRFSHFKNQKRHPVVIYADTECCLTKTDSYTKNGKTRETNYVKARHVVNSYRFQIVSDVPLNIPLQYDYCGPDADQHLVKTLMKIDDVVSATLLQLSRKYFKCPFLPKEQLRQFYDQKECIFCNKELGTDRVRDHCHFTGKYCGAAHKACNIKAYQMKFGKIEIPCFFHNSNYDIRAFINAFSDMEGSGGVNNIDGIPCNLESFKSLTLNNITIKDSYAHLSSSLSKLMENLPDSEKHYLRTIVGDDEEKFKLINGKGLYPYEFVTDISKLDTPIEEIRREHFDSKLKLSKLTDEDWLHFKRVVNVFGIKSLREWHDLYLKIDVLGLTDVMEFYRKLTYTSTGLEPVHYLGLPGLSWDAGFKLTGIELENLSDIDMIMFFEKMKRGGISTISKRHSKANNQYLPNYNPAELKKFLLQLDCNNLYGWAMCQMLPTKGFKWVDTVDMDSYDPSGNIGYAMEVDLEYPDHLHDTHSDYPLAPEHMQLSTRKLTPNLNHKNNYVCYIDTLRYYIQKGMVLTKVHRAVQFEREAWLKPYIDKNSKHRQEAKNDFEKDYYKLLNNAFYGKTMENERDRIKVKFCMDEKKFKKYTSSQLFADHILVIKEGGFSMVKMHQKKVTLSKPIYTGAIVLEMSKLLMFQFHYDTMMKVYPEARMMKTDTDSLMYEICTEDVYQDMKNIPELASALEFSNYPKDHFLYNEDRKKVPGIFQDECVSEGKPLAIIAEYIGLRSKCYANNLYYPATNSFVTKKKAKGVSSVHVKQNLEFEHYSSSLFEKKSYRSIILLVLGR